MAGSKNTQNTGLQSYAIYIQKASFKEYGVLINNLIFKSSIWIQSFQHSFNPLGSRIKALDQQPALIDVTS